MIFKKTTLSWIFSLLVGLAMCAMPTRALAHDHDGDRGRHGWNHDNGWHRGWDRDGDRWGGWNHEDEEDEEEDEHEYSRPYYGYGYYQQEPEDEYFGGYRPYNRSGWGMVNPRHPGLYWACNSQGHHCHWARRPGFGYPYGAYNGYNGYGPNYGASPTTNLLGTVIGPLLGMPIQ